MRRIQGHAKPNGRECIFDSFRFHFPFVTESPTLSSAENVMRLPLQQYFILAQPFSPLTKDKIKQISPALKEKRNVPSDDVPVGLLNPETDSVTVPRNELPWRSHVKRPATLKGLRPFSDSICHLISVHEISRHCCQKSPSAN